MNFFSLARLPFMRLIRKCVAILLVIQMVLPTPFVFAQMIDDFSSPSDGTSSTTTGIDDTIINQEQAPPGDTAHPPILQRTLHLMEVVPM